MARLTYRDIAVSGIPGFGALSAVYLGLIPYIEGTTRNALVVMAAVSLFMAILHHFWKEH